MKVNTAVSGAWGSHSCRCADTVMVINVDGYTLVPQASHTPPANPYVYIDLLLINSKHSNIL